MSLEYFIRNISALFRFFAGLDPDKHLGKTLGEMEPILLEVSIT